MLRLVIWQGFKLISIGITLGLAGAFAATRVLQSLLYGVSPTDPADFCRESRYCCLLRRITGLLDSGAEGDEG